MKYQILSPAEQELTHSIEYYNGIKENLGYKLLLNFEEAVNRILDNPEAWQPLSKNTRRCLLKNFPYGIIYQVQDIVHIIAFMNLKRRANYWKKVVKEEGFKV